MKMFEKTNLGSMSYFLGMEIKQGKDEAFTCQKKYSKKILKKFQMDGCKAARTPMKNKKKSYVKKMVLTKLMKDISGV